MNELTISGYASRFGEQDLGGDIVRRGAFAASLLSRSGDLPMLSDHQRPIGRWTRHFEDATGLFVEGQLTDPVTIRLVRAGKIGGLSIGYVTRRSRDGPKGRDLLQLDLHEVSLVAFPMLPSARLSHAEPLPQPVHNRSIA